MVKKEDLLKRFQNNIGALRAHHWMYYIDIYSGCYYNCGYCLYYLDKKQKIDNISFLSNLEEELLHFKNRGIVYVGARSDVYQPIEKEKQLTRGALSLFLKYKIPIFLITRSDLIIRDLDILKEMSKLSLVEVSITITSKNIEFSKVFEPNTLPHEVRLDLARNLIENEIKVSFHFSPIIPYLETYDQMFKIILEMHSTGAECIYGCIFGLPSKNKTLLTSNLEKIAGFPAKSMLDLYNNGEDEIITPSNSNIYEFLFPIHNFCKDKNIPFISSQIPFLDTIIRTRGIFTYKLPTVGDMYNFLIENDIKIVTWGALFNYLIEHQSVDSKYIEMVREFWDSGVLFNNTNYSFSGGQKESTYVYGDSLSLNTNVIKCI